MSPSNTPPCPCFSPPRAAYHLPRCWGRWRPAQRPRWNGQPANPSRIWSGRIHPASFCRRKREETLENKYLTCTHNIFTSLFPSAIKRFSLLCGANNLLGRDDLGIPGRNIGPGLLPRAVGWYRAPCRCHIPFLSPQLFACRIPALPRPVAPVPRYLDHFIFNVLRQPLLQRLSNHRDLVPEKRDSCN